MQIAVNDRDEIIEFATIGGLPDAVEFTGNIPDGFITDFRVFYQDIVFLIN